MTIKTIYPVKISVYFDKIDFDQEGICGLTTYEQDKNTIRIDISTNYEPEYIVHEIIHCIDFIEEVIDDKIKGESKAYLSQYIFRKIYDRYIKSKKKLK